MRIHPRTLKVARAKNDISELVTRLWAEGLTEIEVVSILAQLTAEYSKWPLRSERHPTSDKRADEA